MNSSLSDDFAIYLIEKQTKIFIKKLGYYLIKIIPYLLKILSVIGTFAMIFIGGEIIFNAIQYYLPLNLDGLNLFFKFGTIPIYLCVGLVLSILINFFYLFLRRLNLF